jgi:hypothetical protein
LRGMKYQRKKWKYQSPISYLLFNLHVDPLASAP